jgi:hypothetical protein
LEFQNPCPSLTDPCLLKEKKKTCCIITELRPSLTKLTELPDGLIDCHVVGDHVIIDQKLELVTNAISLIHQNGGLQQQKK